MACDNTYACTCTYHCERHAKCCECVAYHRSRGEIPGCFFSKDTEKTYDRSLAKFFEDRDAKSGARG